MVEAGTLSGWKRGASTRIPSATLGMNGRSISFIRYLVNHNYPLPPFLRKCGF